MWPRVQNMHSLHIDFMEEKYMKCVSIIFTITNTYTITIVRFAPTYPALPARVMQIQRDIRYVDDKLFTSHQVLIMRSKRWSLDMEEETRTRYSVFTSLMFMSQLFRGARTLYGLNKESMSVLLSPYSLGQMPVIWTVCDVSDACQQVVVITWLTAVQHSGDLTMVNNGIFMATSLVMQSLLK